MTSIAALEAHAEPGRTLNDPQPRTLGPFDQVALWGNLGVSLLGPTAALFVLAPMGAPMSLVAAFTAVIVGTIVGTLPVSMIALAGARTGSPSMVLLRGLFGRQVPYAPAMVSGGRRSPPVATRGAVLGHPPPEAGIGRGTRFAAGDGRRSWAGPLWIGSPRGGASLAGSASTASQVA